MEGMTLLTFFVLAVFVGFEVVSKVSTTLHTPLMSGANAIHGIILVGAILVTGHAHSTVALVLGLVAVVLATMNMGGVDVSPSCGFSSCTVDAGATCGAQN